MKRLLLALLLALPLFAGTTENDASCDIGLFPAATLLLPYFEVGVATGRGGETTTFTITNVTWHEQIAHVTLWTDYGYPALTFNIFLTGYDVQTIDLHDVIFPGQIAPPRGTGFEDSGSPEGDFATDERNPAVREQTCRNLPVNLDYETRNRAYRAFTGGTLPACRVGSEHRGKAVGWATIDVVRSCTDLTPENARYYTNELLFENALTGDYQQVGPGGRRLESGPLVHIRALDNLGKTFYSRFQQGGNRDRRQPLPTSFAAHRVASDNVSTTLKIWREGAARACGSYEDNAAQPFTSRVEVPEAGAGWMHLEFDSQAWVISSMKSGADLAVDSSATALASNCAFFAPRDDESCDIAQVPAATLLLPNFEIDLERAFDTTLFSVANTSPDEHVAHVTLWTDFAWPVLSFDLPLAGYEMQSLSLLDVIGFGRLPAGCDGPRQLDPEVVLRMQNALSRGKAPGCNRSIGTDHGRRAVGYATIDVVRTCTTLDPSQAAYFGDAIAFDNVLTGDYQQIDGPAGSARGGPLVHIRAFPGLELPYTFYSKLQSPATPRADARQPLPHIFAARYTDDTDLVLWLEPERATCNSVAGNEVLSLAEIVTFDEEENAQGATRECHFTCGDEFGFPVTGRRDVHDRSSIFPQVYDATSGWIYLNLGVMFTTPSEDDRGRQGWVISSTEGGTFASDFEAIALGNGCTPRTPESEVNDGTLTIGPAPKP